jgi:hypothetical protein
MLRKMDGRIPDAVGFVWEQADKRLEAQMRQADALDTKAGALVGLHALAVGLVASFAPRSDGPGRWIAASAIAGLLLSGLFAFLAYRAESYDRRPSPRGLWTFGNLHPDAIKYEFLTTRFRSLETNHRLLERKARRIAVSLAAITVIAFCVGVLWIVGQVT